MMFVLIGTIIMLSRFGEKPSSQTGRK